MSFLFLEEIIVVTNCDGSVDSIQSMIRIKNDSANPIFCTWTIFSPTGGQIIVNLIKPFNKNYLKISDAIQFGDEESLIKIQSSNITAQGNILRVQYSTKLEDSDSSLLFNYKTTGNYQINCMPIV